MEQLLMTSLEQQKKDKQRTAGKTSCKNGVNSERIFLDNIFFSDGKANNKEFLMKWLNIVDIPIGNIKNIQGSHFKDINKETKEHCSKADVFINIEFYNSASKQFNFSLKSSKNASHLQGNTLNSFIDMLKTNPQITGYSNDIGKFFEMFLFYNMNEDKHKIKKYIGTTKSRSVGRWRLLSSEIFHIMPKLKNKVDKFLVKNSVPIAKYIYKEGNDKNRVADYLAHIRPFKSEIKNSKFFHIDEVIEAFTLEAIKNDTVIHYNKSSISFLNGLFSLDMKGSGTKDYLHNQVSHYHSLQFKHCSMSKIEKILKERNQE